MFVKLFVYFLVAIPITNIVLSPWSVVVTVTE